MGCNPMNPQESSASTYANDGSHTHLPSDIPVRGGLGKPTLLS